MKLYSSFLFRCWLIHDPAHDERPVIDIEHIQTGSHTRAASLTEAEAWMFEACRAMRAPAEAGRDSGRETNDGR